MGYHFKRILAASSISLLALLSTQSYASGYHLVFESVSTLADAGDAAVINDASTNFYNSSGLVYLPQQAVFGGFAVYAPATFQGTTTAPNSSGFTFVGTGSSSSHTYKVLPLFHYTRPFLNRYAFGISVMPVWGLNEEYGASVATRYDLIRIYTRTIDISPSLAARITDQFSLGAGPDMHYFSLQSKNAARLQFLSATQPDSLSRSVGQSWAWGYHIGAMYRIDNATRVGINYTSKIVHTLNGYSHLSFYQGGLVGGQSEFETNQFTLRISMPPSTRASIYHDFTDKFALMGTVVYDQWASVANLLAKNYQSITSLGASKLITVPLPHAYHNTFDYAIGAHYKYSDKIMFRGALKYEATPTNNLYRDIDFPDAQKLGIHVGLSYYLNPRVTLNGIYGHVFTNSQPVNTTNSVTGVNNNGTIKSSNIDFIGAEAVWDIC